MTGTHKHLRHSTAGHKVGCASRRGNIQHFATALVAAAELVDRQAAFILSSVQDVRVYGITPLSTCSVGAAVATKSAYLLGTANLNRYTRAGVLHVTLQGSLHPQHSSRC